MRIWSISARAYGAIPIPLHQASKASELSMDKLLENRRPPRYDTRQPGRRLAPTEIGAGLTLFSRHRRFLVLERADVPHPGFVDQFLQ